MKTLIFSCVASFLAASIFADSPEKSKPQPQTEERLVFVTGSRIPKRIKVQRTGTKTTSPIRVISRPEIDQNGRPTTPGALANDPSVSVIGH